MNSTILKAEHPKNRPNSPPHIAKKFEIVCVSDRFKALTWWSLKKISTLDGCILKKIFFVRIEILFVINEKNFEIILCFYQTQKIVPLNNLTTVAWLSNQILLGRFQNQTLLAYNLLSNCILDELLHFHLDHRLYPHQIVSFRHLCSILF